MGSSSTLLVLISVISTLPYFNAPFLQDTNRPMAIYKVCILPGLRTVKNKDNKHELPRKFLVHTASNTSHNPCHSPTEESTDFVLLM